MKVTELREKLRNLEKAELQSLIVEMYKLIPKSVKDGKDIDALIDNPEQFKEKKKIVKATASTIDFDVLKKEIEQFIEHANAQYYVISNRVVPKKERSNWRLTAKRLIDELTVVASDISKEKECADLFEQFYRLFAFASSHYIFVSEEPFQTLKIPQEQFLKRVIILKKHVELPKQWIRTATQLILEYGVDRETLTSDLVEVLVAELSNEDLQKQAIIICDQLLDEQFSQLNSVRKSSKNGFLFTPVSSKHYSIMRKMNLLIELSFILQSQLGNKQQAIDYFEAYWQERSVEIKLYQLLNLIKNHQQIGDWLAVYENAITNGIEPRESLRKQYNYVKSHGEFDDRIW